MCLTEQTRLRTLATAATIPAVTIQPVLILTAMILAVTLGGCRASAPSTATVKAVEGERPEDFVSIAEYDPSILLDIRYVTPHNFLGEPVPGYLAAQCLLTTEAAKALKKVQSALLKAGYSLKVYDCYRPQTAVNAFVAWVEGAGSSSMKGEFYPHVERGELIKQGYIADRSGHSRGSTLDLTLVELPAAEQPEYIPGETLRSCTAPRRQRFADNSIDMATGFDCFDPKAHTAVSGLTTQQKQNRQRLVAAMQAQGFKNYAAEWWHYRLEDEPYPDTYFDFPVNWSP